MTRNVLVVLALTTLTAAACSSGSSAPTKAGQPPAAIGDVSTKPPVPPEFLAACGHPGASVQVQRVPVTVRHADCDLTGVTVSIARRGGAVVGSEPGGVGNSQGFRMTIAKHTLDVTISAHGPIGNA